MAISLLLLSQVAMRLAVGAFVGYISEISDDYVFQLYTAILDHPKVDCLGMRAIITQNDFAHPRIRRQIDNAHLGRFVIHGSRIFRTAVLQAQIQKGK